jgi:general secretion pathway protein K
MIGTKLQRERGIALLMTLAFITLAISVALETNRQSRLALENTGAVRARLAVGQMATAGVHGAMAVLVQDRTTSATDHLKETWADAEKLQEALAPIAFDGGRLEVRIVDEMARIQVNALVDFPQSRSFNPQQQQILLRLIEQLRQKHEMQGDPTATDMVNAIKDWLDTGDDDAISGLNGAETDYYQNLDPPYAARNGPMRHIGELARIRGLSAELVRGRGDIDGLQDLMTVHGAVSAANGRFTFSGKINLNTASQSVIAALMPAEASDLAEALIEYRDAAEAAALESQAWYRGAPGATALESNADRFTLATNLFRIQATAERNGFKQTISAVVERYMAADGKGWTCRILAWETG